jgi:methylenetetrahydrofolate reductase (NADPH)
MKVIEHLSRAQSPLLSFEIVPPPRGKSVKDIIEIVEDLLPLNPAWIDVTAHASQADLVDKGDGSFQRRISRKRPGTIGICGVIQNRFKIDTVAHLLCLGFTKEETEDALIELQYLGVENVLALRGDSPNFEKRISSNRSTNEFASDLVEQLSELRHGRYLQDIESSNPMDFCVGVAGYPEKHIEAPNLAIDLKYLKEKVDLGAHYIVTQMFFETKHYLRFREDCVRTGISAPIVPGLKLIHLPTQLKRIPKTFNVDLPEDLTKEVLANPKHTLEIGQRHCLKQCQELLAAGAPVLHFYVMNDAKHVVQVIKQLGL